jgi:amino acid permease
MKLNKYWFKPKKYGYGATPSTWEGYIATLLFVVIIFLITKYTIIEDDNVSRFIGLLGSFILVFIYITIIKTKEKWKWRWGNK